MALRLAVDTNRYRDYVGGSEEAAAVIDSGEEVWIPFIVLAELRAGFLHGNRHQKNERLLRGVLNEPHVNVLYADEATIYFYAQLFVELRRAGTPIPDNDLWIASLVIQHDLVLFTRDRHFDRIARIPRI